MQDTMQRADAGRIRDPERSRRRILDSAEALFADKGYDATSLAEVGERAGVSRGTPGYFFGSKENLYRAVLNRTFEDARRTVAIVRERIRDEHDLEQVLSFGIEVYIDYLTEHPNFVRLIEWESLTGGRFLGQTPPHLTSMREGLALVGEEGLGELMTRIDPAQLLISLMALCWFPLSHADTVLRALGMRADDPAFLVQRKRHVITLVLDGIRRR